VDGSQSHTHGIGLKLISWVWTDETGNVIGDGETTDLTLPVVNTSVLLTVTDDGGNSAAESTIVTIKPRGFPEVVSLSPDNGKLGGGELVTITGLDTSFTNVVSVRFGEALITDIDIVSSTTIRVVSPSPGFTTSIPVPVSVITPVGESNSVLFRYNGGVPIEFNIQQLLDLSSFGSPASVAFGPDEKLYVGSTNGRIAKISFTGSSFVGGTVDLVSQAFTDDRVILGLAFDPLDTNTIPTVYCTSSDIFHGEYRDSFGNAINGQIVAVSGANLDQKTTIVSGLPVSELDHALNSITFGNNGEIYLQSGSNTNGGIKGQLSRSQQMVENYFSASTMIVNLGETCFNGAITYNAEVEGTPITGFGPTGVEVFAPGNRNPFGIVMHSNGYLYGTDNGPNEG